MNSISGPGYWAPLAPGFTVTQANPAMGVYRLLPPGVSPYGVVEAMLQVRPVAPWDFQPLLANLGSLENPMVAWMSCASLGLSNILGILPFRQAPMPQGLTHIREFDAVAMTGFPVRVMVMVIQGPQSAVEVVIMMNLYRWMVFVAPCLDFVARIAMAGMQAPGPQSPPPQLQAVVDDKRKNQIEYRLITPNGQPVALTALPTNVGGTTVIHIDTLIQTGNINGTGIAVGTHSMAAVTRNATGA